MAAFLLLLCSLTWAQDLFDRNLTPEGVLAALDAGAEVDARDADSWTPLMVAAVANDNPEVLQVLLEAGADVEARDKWGWTPLLFAARSNENSEVVQVLLDAGSDPSTQDNEGKTAWDHIQENDALKDTDAYSELKDRSSDE